MAFPYNSKHLRPDCTVIFLASSFPGARVGSSLAGESTCDQIDLWVGFPCLFFSCECPFFAAPLFWGGSGQLLINSGPIFSGKQGVGIISEMPRNIKRAFSHNQGSEDKTHNSHEFYQDVHGRSGGIFQRISNSISHDGSSVYFRSFATQMPLFYPFFCIISCGSGVGHENPEKNTACRRSG